MLLVFFIIIATIISFIDYKKRLIPDKIILPSIIMMLFLKWGDGILTVNDFIAMGIVIVVFVIPILFGMTFGGGDIRFGVFCALFLGLEQVGVFIALSGVIHLLILAVLQKKSFAFAPAMTLASLVAYMVGNI
ncbi:prepilin peptidase [Sulfurimonas sp. C5]|uniref:prepilin peptidase n=1 Tax=Sulfurimonas sp. C5 TaxID=3036947 RepID=UPI002454C4FE|nr:prepilin peptidase [Sulfurimonas sp. C5]MDH4944300.1 prepilin peptidase [Sulfurimonas sp. C5]